MTKYALTNVLKNSFFKKPIRLNGVLDERASVRGGKSRGTKYNVYIEMVIIYCKNLQVIYFYINIHHSKLLVWAQIKNTSHV